MAHVLRRDSDDLTGHTLDGRYRLVALIGAGASAHVYRAERLGLGRVVAVKVMNAKADADACARFERDAMTMAKLEHPHCAAVFDVGVYCDRPYVVMELVTGEPLDELVARGPLSVARAVEIMRQILSGLAHAHEHGIIHRAIKPSNVMLAHKSCLGDQAKILFGIANGDDDSATHAIGGDLYACALLLRDMLPPRSGLEAVLARALSKQLDERYATAHDFARALGAVAPDATIELDVDDMTLAQTSASMFIAPAGAADAAAKTSAITSDTAAKTSAIAPAPAKSRRNVVLVGIAAIAVATIVLVLLFAPRRDAAPAAEPVVRHEAPVAAAPDAGTPVNPTDNLLAAAEQLASAGRRDAAIDVLVAASNTHRNDARLPYRAATLYFDKLWWADGLDQLRVAIARDAAYKTDAELIKLVVRAFNTTPRYDGRLAKFLCSDIGPPAKPYLEETARRHRNPKIRARAKAALRRID